MHSQNPLDTADSSQHTMIDRLQMLRLAEKPAFARLTRLAAHTLKAPMVIVTLADNRYEYPISGCGIPESVMRQERFQLNSLTCRNAKDPLAISRINNTADCDHQPQKSILGAVARLNVPLLFHEETLIGTMCVMDVTPREWTDDEVHLSQEFAHSVVTEIELSLKVAEIEQVRQELSAERDLLRTLIDTFPDYIFIKDVDGRFIISNQAHTEAANIETQERLVGKTAFDTFPQELAEQYESDDRTVIQSGEPLINLERQTVGPDGRRRWVLTSKVPFRGRDGRISGLVGISRDISDRKEAEETLRDREKFIEQILTTSPGIVSVYDLLSRRNIYSNLEISNVLGYEAKDIAQMGPDYINLLMHPDDLARLPSRIAAIEQLRDNEISEFEYRLRAIHGEYRWFYSRDVVFARDEHGKPTQTIGATVDITRMKLAETALRESEQRIRTLLNYAPIVLFELDERGYVTLAEGRGLAALGLSPGSIKGKSAFDVLVNRPHLILRLERALRGEAMDFIYDTEQVVYQMSFLPAFAPDSQQIVKVLGIGIDVTEQIRARDQAAESSARLKHLHDIDEELNASLELQRVLQTTLQAAIDSCNAQEGFIALLEGDDLRVQQRIGEEQPEENKRLNRKEYLDVFNSQRARFIVPARKKSNNQSSRMRLVVPLTLVEKSIGLLQIDIPPNTEVSEDALAFVTAMAGRAAVAVTNAQLYTQLQQVYEKVRSLEQIKTDMIRIAAHDLRNPMTAARGYVSLLEGELKPDITPTQQDYINSLYESLRSMQQIIIDILSLQRIEALHDQGNYVEVDLAALVAKIFNENRQKAEAKQLRFIEDISQTPVFVHGDQPQLREAIDNLIGNAIKYTPNAGTVTIRLHAEAMVLFEVSDTGYGIPDNLQSRIFQPFFRAKTPQTRMVEGTGLGLHLVKNIIERHHGKMHFVSAVGKGSTFGFHLPPLQNSEKKTRS